MVGSSNFNRRSLDHDEEVVLAALDETFVATLDEHFDEDLTRSVTIRGEAQTALAAIVRQISHYGGHAHQIVLLAKHLKGAGWTVLSIPRGASAAYTAASRAAARS